MTERPENPFQPRLGTMRAAGSPRRARSFLSEVSRSMARAGPRGRRYQGHRKRRFSTSSARRVIVKARYVKTAASSLAALSKHLEYIGRDEANRAEKKDALFGPELGGFENDEFIQKSSEDRHHFRFIVSPEDGGEMSDLKPFVQGLVASMEQDLGTKLDWVAAVHDDTDHPHAHIVVRGRRDDGSDLVIPRSYISHGIREQAQSLVTLELGPQTQLEKDLKLARQTRTERLTQVDRSLAKAHDVLGYLDLRTLPAKYRAMNQSRLGKLHELGLAENLGGSNWKLAEGFIDTLKELGERNDIVKSLNRAIENKAGRSINASSVGTQRKPIVGAVLEKGVRGEMHDQPFVIIDCVDGNVLAAGANSYTEIQDVEVGMIVSLDASPAEPKSSDYNIAAISQKNGGDYSASLHQKVRPQDKSEFITAHVRRLEALRRRGFVRKSEDGIWKLPTDFLAKAKQYEEEKAASAQPRIRVQSWVDLSSQVSASGYSWLDEARLTGTKMRGFGEEVLKAREQRAEFLKQRGRNDSSAHRSRIHGVSVAGQNLQEALGKRFLTAPTRGEITGVYTNPINLPEGRYAIVERERSFTLVPWRKVMEQSRGRQISGRVTGNSITWTIGRSRHLGR